MLQRACSGRYGAFFLAPSNFEECVQRDVHLDVDALRALEGRHVRIALRILESRPSGHAGDQFLKVFPGTPPDVGDVIELAVGRLLLSDHRHHDVRYHPTQVGIGTAPSDGPDSADLLVVGTRGAAQPSSDLGSVSAAVARGTPCPLLLAPPAAWMDQDTRRT